MSSARVLVVDDSAVIRRILTDVLSSDPEIEVVGTASNGTMALEKFEKLAPDLITLDVEMPGMSGLDLLSEIRRRSPKVPVVMFSTLTQRAASTTLDALARGATDYVTKPSNTGSREAATEHVRSQLVPRIKALASASKIKTAAPAVEPRRRPSIAPMRTRLDLLMIASSTGGPNALSQLFRGFVAPLPVPALIVQHMPAVFTRILAERLASTSGLPVHEAEHGARLERGHFYVAPGDHHMKVERDGNAVRLVLDQGPPENSCRPAADVTLRSVASVYGGHVLALVLTGMGQDGLRGIEVLRPLGAQVVVQDEASSVVWGMPGVVASNGLADEVLPLPEIAASVLRRLGNPFPQVQAHAG